MSEQSQRSSRSMFPALTHSVEFNPSLVLSKQIWQLILVNPPIGWLQLEPIEAVLHALTNTGGGLPVPSQVKYAQ